ncbi:Mismatch repair protein msh3 [Malassezia yamatoensis]|uniref:DNA mismatch repair protein MSH3 n=1 Tax=Malassezia yamatoensis TaxID=253288 RepID=A0AAJ6CG83_9BASI|nr:Mismatch repair protein msh3 [Malassezia yamatoensis]
MPPKQASLHAFFGGERTTKRPRIEAEDVAEPKDITPSEDDVAGSSLKDTGTQLTTKRAQHSNPLDSHRFDPSDSTQREIRPLKIFENVVKPTNKSGPVKYTPLELQILQLKKEHPGVLLLVEVGYKMKFYQEDARVASRVLNILIEACFPEKNLQSAMIPVPRLSVHVKRLVAAGYKVGVCRQTETRALKAATENANKPFTRALTALYTASTWLDDMDAVQSPEERGSEQSLVSVSESCNGNRSHIGITSVDVVMAAVQYDAFDDDSIRSELETRLAHLSPREIIMPHGLSAQTERVLQSYAKHAPDDRPVRIERREDLSREQARNVFSEMTFQRKSEFLVLVQSFDSQVQNALAQLIRYLEPYQLTWAFGEPQNYTAFRDRAYMLLNSHTLRNLELMYNATDGKVYGSLLWHLDRCRTPMGKRLLRQWLRRPLLDPKKISERVQAVDVLRERHASVLHQAISLLTRLPDLSRGLARIAYGLVEPTEMATVLLTLHRVTREFSFSDASEVQSGSELLDEAIFKLSKARDPVTNHLKEIRIEEARKNLRTELFFDENRYKNIAHWKAILAQNEAGFQSHLQEIRTVLQRPNLQYVSIAGLENLVEVRVADASKTPADWIRVNSTKTAVRFHTPTILRMTQQREQHREQLAEAGRIAWLDYVQCVSQDYASMWCVVRSIAEIDALLSLSEVASQPGYVKPKISTEDTLVLRDFRHPVAEAMRSEPFVPNTIQMGGKHPRAVLLTGSNMGGKSSTVRAIALALIMTQIGSFVPCSYACMPCHDLVATRMGAQDDLAKGKSTFMVEAEETAQILKSATPRSLLLLDEFGRGTSTFDGAALAYAVLHALLTPEDRPKVLFITHYASLGELAEEFPSRIANMHMATHLNTRGNEADLVFLHKLRHGLASESLGIYVAKLAGLPVELVEHAREKARSLSTIRHNRQHVNELHQYITLVSRAFCHDDPQAAWPLAQRMVQRLNSCYKTKSN